MAAATATPPVGAAGVAIAPVTEVAEAAVPRAAAGAGIGALVGGNAGLGIAVPARPG